MARAEVRADMRAGRASRRRAREADAAVRSRRACPCACHKSRTSPHPGEPCICKRISKAVSDA